MHNIHHHILFVQFHLIDLQRFSSETHIVTDIIKSCTDWQLLAE